MELKKKIAELPGIVKLLIAFTCGVGLLTSFPHLFENVFGFTEFASGVCTFGVISIFGVVFYKVFK